MAKKSKKRNQQPSNAPRNFVHVHGLTFNKSAVYEDRRKAQKSGKRKHKTAWVNIKDPGGFSLELLSFSTPRHSKLDLESSPIHLASNSVQKSLRSIC